MRNQTKPSRGIWCCNHIFHGGGDAVVVADIVMVRKYGDLIFLAYVETGMFLFMMPCNVTVLLLNLYI
jgi:hypothetical protein